MSRFIKYMVVASSRAVGYEWLGCSGWEHLSVACDLGEDGEILQTHKGCYPYFAAGALDRYQAIGFPDKHNKEIYEGAKIKLDFIGIPARHNRQFGEDVETDIRTVVWIKEDAAFGWEWIDGERPTGPSLCESNSKYMEIVSHSIEDA